MAVPRREIREGHLVATTDVGLDVMDLACEAVWRQPLRHRIGIEERSVDPLGWCAKYPMKFDRVLSHGALLLVCVRQSLRSAGQPRASAVATNEERPDRHGPVAFSKQARPCDTFPHFPAVRAARPRVCF